MAALGDDAETQLGEDQIISLADRVTKLEYWLREQERPLETARKIASKLWQEIVPNIHAALKNCQAEVRDLSKKFDDWQAEEDSNPLNERTFREAMTIALKKLNRRLEQAGNGVKLQFDNAVRWGILECAGVGPLSPLKSFKQLHWTQDFEAESMPKLHRILQTAFEEHEDVLCLIDDDVMQLGIRHKAQRAIFNYNVKKRKELATMGDRAQAATPEPEEASPKRRKPASSVSKGRRAAADDDDDEEEEDDEDDDCEHGTKRDGEDSRNKKRTQCSQNFRARANSSEHEDVGRDDRVAAQRAWRSSEHDQARRPAKSGAGPAPPAGSGDDAARRRTATGIPGQADDSEPRGNLSSELPRASASARSERSSSRSRERKAAKDSDDQDTRGGWMRHEESKGAAGPDPASPPARARPQKNRYPYE